MSRLNDEAALAKDQRPSFVSRKISKQEFEMFTQADAEAYVFIEDLKGLSEGAPEDSIVSRSIYKNGKTNVTLFDFAAGQALSEHSAASPAMIHILSGQATISFGDHAYEAHDGSWAYMQPRLSHSIVAKTAVKMLLIMLPNAIVS